MSDNQGVELLPCPFCGAADGQLVQAFTRATETFAYWSVECLKCACEIASDSSQAEADAAWNTRAQPASAGVLVEALRPFAREADAQERVTSFRDGDCIIPRTKITIGDLRRARQALSATATPASDGVPVGDGVIAPERIWLCGFNTHHGDISWSSCPDPTDDPEVDGQQVEYIRLHVTPDRFGEGYRAGVEAAKAIVREEGPQNPEHDWTDYARARASMRDNIVRRLESIRTLQPDAGEGA